MATTDMIRFENVKKIYTGLDAKSKDIVALHNVNLSIKKANSCSFWAIPARAKARSSS
ncbi:MAG: hypothetical protein ACLS9Y_06665 [Ruthenibacterium lactatiformans]